ncbi:MAG TPA: divergent PAP2 family protein [Patescibacteria group bacterium]|nr:divergent PAP2 family protein [Patescibacteria group bacterium]
MDYSYLIIPIIVGITSQVLKLLTDGIKGNFDLKNLYETYGGFPSSHTAFAVSIATLIGLRQNLSSPIFAVAFVFSFLIVRDALGFRNFLGKQGKILNHLINKLPKEERKNMPRFRERMGHNAIEVLGGVILGVGLTYFLNLI